MRRKSKTKKGGYEGRVSRLLYSFYLVLQLTKTLVEVLKRCVLCLGMTIKNVNLCLVDYIRA